jgi:hypothetical protein
MRKARASVEDSMAKMKEAKRSTGANHRAIRAQKLIKQQARDWKASWLEGGKRSVLVGQRPRAKLSISSGAWSKLPA